MTERAGWGVGHSDLPLSAPPCRCVFSCVLVHCQLLTLWATITETAPQSSLL